MKTIKDVIEEGLFSSKVGILKRLNKIEVKDEEWGKLGVNGQGAISTLLFAIDYIADNADEFGKYTSTENAIRDAINNALEEGGYSKKFTI